MTQEEKAKAYDKLFIKAKRIYNKENDVLIMHAIENLFPELKESEDERIRKELIDYHRSMAAQADDYVHEAWIAWLEKQGEHKPTIEMKTPEESLGIDSETYNKIIDECIYGENKPDDNVEPKFKVGDWVVENGINRNPVQITSFEEDKGSGIKVWFSNGKGTYIEFLKGYHKWTIQDAKDGDVLAFYGEYKGNKMLQVGIIERYVGKHGGCSNTFKIYVGVNWESNLQIGEYMGCSDIRPATKEQRDTLMKAMADAGYTFDFEKKKMNLTFLWNMS